MFNFLHTISPSPILINIGPVHIYWYGFFVVAGMVMATLVSLALAKRHNIPRDTMLDLIFYVILFGVIGARVYHIFLELPYYLENPLQMIMVWKGGLAIHGGLIAGLVTLLVYSSRHAKQLISPSSIEQRSSSDTIWLFSSILVSGVVLGQAIGRWGNYFNQELFGTPTTLPWGIPIDIMRRPVEYISAEYFHPTFLYESLGCLIIFAILMLVQRWIIRKDKSPKFYTIITASYFILYSLLRFSLEFIKTDPTPYILGMRWPQIISILIIVASILSVKLRFKKRID